MEKWKDERAPVHQYIRPFDSISISTSDLIAIVMFAAFRLKLELSLPLFIRWRDDCPLLASYELNPRQKVVSICRGGRLHHCCATDVEERASSSRGYPIPSTTR